MQVRLVVVGGKQAGTEIAIRGPEFLIGRGAECHLQPRSGLVSRKHCSISVEGDVVTVRDFGSTNGTLVNGERVRQRRELTDGDHIKVGLLELEVRIAAAGSRNPKAVANRQASERQKTAGDDDLDISGWLEPDQQGPSVAEPDARTAVQDTIAAKPGDETATDIPTTIGEDKPGKKEPKPTRVPANSNGRPSRSQKAVNRPPRRPFASSSTGMGQRHRPWHELRGASPRHRGRASIRSRTKRESSQRSSEIVRNTGSGL